MICIYIYIHINTYIYVHIYSLIYLFGLMVWTCLEYVFLCFPHCRFGCSRPQVGVKEQPVAQTYLPPHGWNMMVIWWWYIRYYPANDGKWWWYNSDIYIYIYIMFELSMMVDIFREISHEKWTLLLSIAGRHHVWPWFLSLFWGWWIKQELGVGVASTFKRLSLLQ